jgi:hypothetical protein
MKCDGEAIRNGGTMPLLFACCGTAGERERVNDGRGASFLIDPPELEDTLPRRWRSVKDDLGLRVLEGLEKVCELGLPRTE